MSKPQTTKRRRFAVEVVLPVVAVLAVIGIAHITDPAPVARATIVPHASAELCYAYYVWAKQAHDTSPGMERECSKP